MKKGQTHPAALTSRKLLSNALIELMQEKEYKSITITEICTRSQVARRTFYRNFNTMDDVLVFFIKDIINDFTIEIKKHATDTFYDILFAYFSFWKNHSGILTLLNQNGLTHIIFTEYIKCLQQIPFLCCPNAAITMESEEFPCILAFTAGGLWSLLTYWISHNCTKTPQELAKIIKDVIEAGKPLVAGSFQ